MSKIAVIGSGFSGLSAASYLAKAGHEVHVFEKNAFAGGRASQFRTHGFVFDKGPSWYWMPEIFENFFRDFGYQISDFYELKLLNPSFEVVFGKKNTIIIPAEFSALCDTFESIEKGAGENLRKFLAQAGKKYKIAMGHLSNMPGLSYLEFAKWELMKGMLRPGIFSSFSKYVHQYFRNPKLIALMEFPVIFLGAMPQETPALYSLMNYAGLKLGTYYPKGGFGKIVEAMQEVATNLGVQFHFETPVTEIISDSKRVKSLRTPTSIFEIDALIASADYHHVENQLLNKSTQNYSEKYWDSRTFAPSCLIYFLGISKKIPQLKHHTLFFEEDLLPHTLQIYKTPEWPHNPLFYVCAPSQTDDTVAPEGHENLFLLMPIAVGLKDEELTKELYFQKMLGRIENHIEEKISDSIIFKKSYCVSDFISEYNAYKGNAYGLANTLRQTATLKPKIRNRKLKNLFYAGQLTVPGPGVPPSILSGKIAAQQFIKSQNKHSHERIV